MQGGALASEAFVKRFRTETEAAAPLDHPNILLDTAGEPLGTLSKWVRRRPAIAALTGLLPVALIVGAAVTTVLTLRGLALAGLSRPQKNGTWVGRIRLKWVDVSLTPTLPRRKA